MCARGWNMKMKRYCVSFLNLTAKTSWLLKKILNLICLWCERQSSFMEDFFVAPKKKCLMSKEVNYSDINKTFVPAWDVTHEQFKYILYVSERRVKVVLAQVHDRKCSKKDCFGPRCEKIATTPVAIWI